MIRDAHGNPEDETEFAFFAREQDEDARCMTPEQSILMRKFGVGAPRRPLRPWAEIEFMLDHREELADLTIALSAKYEFLATYERHTTLRLRAIA